MLSGILSQQSRCRGAFLGHLIGDCLGSPFEGLPVVYHSHLNTYFSQLLDPKLKVPFKPYTGNTAMMKGTAQSLISCKKYDPADMAHTLAKEYFKDPKRIYGRGVTEVFMKLRLSGFEDPYGPAKGMYQGLGSFGNAAAIRVLPVPFFFSKLEDVIDMSIASSKLTHTHRIGYIGAVLRACAIHQIISHKETSQKLSYKDFLKSLSHILTKLEANEAFDEFNTTSEKEKMKSSFVRKLEDIERLLDKQSSSGSTLLSVEDIAATLGPSISALGSVSTSIYCLFAAQMEIEEIQSTNTLVRCLHLAYSFGSNTDTLGCIVGSLVGAQMGDSDSVEHEVLKTRCEAPGEIGKLADAVSAICSGDPLLAKVETA